MCTFFARGIPPLSTQVSTHAILEPSELCLQVWLDPDVSFSKHMRVTKRFHTMLLPTHTPLPCSAKLTVARGVEMEQTKDLVLNNGR